jgi:hypothetical protein
MWQSGSAFRSPLHSERRIEMLDVRGFPESGSRGLEQLGLYRPGWSHPASPAECVVSDPPEVSLDLENWLGTMASTQVIAQAVQSLIPRGQ